jgi:putative ABC transport system ATP-binding protein
LVGNPDVIFADEPTAALDSESGMVVVKMLKRLGQVRGTTTVMVTHDNRILEMADRIVTLEDGRIVRDTMPFDPMSSAGASARSVETAALTTIHEWVGPHNSVDC